MLYGYFDNAATTELCYAAKSAITEALDLFGNPSSFHKAGQRSADMIDCARHTVASFIKAKDEEIIFTSGGTESDNLAIIGAAESQKRRGRRIVTTAFEHSAVMGAAGELEKRGFDVVRLAPSKDGTVDISAFEEAINSDTVLVSCMSVNNETGAVLPIDKIKSVINKAASPALFHIDATQSFGKYPIYPERLGADFLSFSSHKIHGPKGVGALYIRSGRRILPQLYGGEQQSGIRPGTEPTLLIAGFAAAISDIGDMAENAKKVAEIRNYLANELGALDGVLINSPDNASDYVLNISLMGYKSETVLHYLDSLGFCVSSGSACSKGKQSHVLTALGFDKKRSDCAVRISFSKYNTIDEANELYSGIVSAKNTLFRAR